MHRKLLSILLSFTVIAGMLAIASPSAQAASSTASPTGFLPDDDSTAVSNSTVLADRFDGADTTTHLTAVTNTPPERVQWRVCPVAVTDPGPAGGTFSASDLSACNITMGEDTTPAIPGPSSNFTNADEAYDIFFDVPPSLDNQTRDVLILACVGAGEVTDPAAGTVNCQVKLEENIVFDDANTGEPDATTGEMVSYCTRDRDVTGPDTGGPGSFGVFNHAEEPCSNAAAASTAERTETASFFKAFPHGSAVPNNGFVLRATSSTDVTDLHAARDFGADSDTDPQVADHDVACTNLQTLADRITWECQFPNQGAADNNIAQAVWIYNNVGGTATPGGADCDTSSASATDRCTLDSHFAVSQARRAVSVKQSFVNGGGGTGHTHQPPDPPANAGCDPGETATKTHTNNNLNNVERVELCMFDQFTDPFAAGAFTEEVSAPGNIGATGGPFTSCTSTADHDGNGSREHCHGVTDVNGHAYADVSDFNATPGTITITSCFETEVQTGATPPANHGCANEAAGVKDTLTLTYGTEPGFVKAAFTPNSASDPCNGPSFQQGTVGDHEEFVVCTVDVDGNYVSTGTKFFLRYAIFGAHGNDAVAVRFNPAPPPDGTGADGKVTVGIDDVAEGDNFIQIDICNRSNGICTNTNNGSALIEKQVLGGEPEPRDVPTNLTAKRGRKFIRGKAKTEDECQPGRQVTLFRRRKGADDVIGVDSTNALGRWGVKTGKVRGTYYARIAASQATDAQTGGQLNCLPDQSKDVRRQ